ncbi:MAG: hypothetical protein Q8N83_12460 [Ignavibacteria bacterium]|nr:hypothetical protein [Ignavibacteria bacterium]
MNILLYDKSPTISSLIQKNLLQIGAPLSVKMVFDINTVMESLHDVSYNLIIMDMENMEGKYSILINLIKKKNPAALVILLSSHPNTKIFNYYHMHGTNYCFDKVTEFDLLLKKLDEFFSEENEENILEEKR